jgi:NAD-dependent deacetylase
MEMIDEAVRALRNAERCTVLTGAGISAESGVPTFRGAEGLWGKFRPEELATMDAFLENPQIVWEWYNWRRKLLGEVKPNPGHYALAELAGMVDDFSLITQNVDGLHAVAGSMDILELHGNIRRNKCSRCNEACYIEDEVDPMDIPTCKYCGGKIRPDVVWFGEMLNSTVIERAFVCAERADVFLSVGTSAVVHPAASLPITAKRAGAILVEINPEPTPLSEIADFRFERPSGDFLPILVDQLREAVRN